MAALLLAAAAAMPVQTAARAFGDAVPAAVQGDIAGARIAGEGEYRWFGLKLYDARLWMGERGVVSLATDAPAFALELRYARRFTGERIAQASIAEIKKLGLGNTAQHEAWLGTMEKTFPDVEEGSRITGLYLPGRGARFYLDGSDIGTIEDPEFGQAFFSIWLSDGSSAPGLRRNLLRHARHK